jgi:hypothetical protein
MSRVSPSIRSDAYEILTGARKLTADDNGKTFFLNAAGGMAITLPAPELGFECTFIVKTALTSNATITSVDAAGAAANITKGHVLTTDVNSATDADFDTTAVDVVTLAANKAVAGDLVKFVCDGSIWYYRAEVSVFDAIAAA